MDNLIKIKAIYNPAMARKLLKAGNPIKDIKPDSANRDKTVFLFEETSKLLEDFVALADR